MNKTKNVRAIYTVLTGDYDLLRTPRYIEDGWDYICFTDREEIRSNVWKVVKMDNREELDSIRLARKYKILCHEFLKEYEESIFIDANVQLTGYMTEYIEQYGGEHSLLCVDHPERDDIYEEARACIDQKKDREDVILSQMDRYRSEGMPEHNGMIYSGCLYRKHSDPNLQSAMCAWWEEVHFGSRRDQLSFNYIAWKTGYEYDHININISNNPFWVINSHLRKSENALDILMNYITPNSSILSLGGGINGKDFRHVCEELRGMGCTVEFEYENVAHKEMFDYVICADVLEHMSDPFKVIKDIHSMIKENGKLLVALPNVGHNDILIKLFRERFDYTNTGLLDDTNIHFFSLECIKPFFENAGYNILDLKYTEIETGNTEQFCGIDYQLDPLIMNAIKERTGGEIYQFIICAEKSRGMKSNVVEALKMEPHVEFKTKIYFDRGYGFSEDETELVSLKKTDDRQYSLEYHLDRIADIRSIRFDPIEGQMCLVTKCEVMQGTHMLNAVYSFNLPGKHGIALITNDPMITFENLVAGERLDVKIEFVIEGRQFIEGLMDNNQEALNEINNLREELMIARQKYDHVISTWSWRITGPFRRAGQIAGRIKSIFIADR